MDYQSEYKTLEAKYCSAMIIIKDLANIMNSMAPVIIANSSNKEIEKLSESINNICRRIDTHTTK